jgi:hypothetical protein
MRSATLALFLFIAATLNAQHDQKITTFDVPAATNTIPMAISQSGDIIGDSSAGIFLRKHSGAFTILTFNHPSTPTAINAGWIAGYYSQNPLIGPPAPGFVQSPDGIFTTVLPAGASNVLPRAINTTAEVVGQYIDIGQQKHGFIWTPARGVSTFDVDGSIVTAIYAINPTGEFTGYYTNFRGVEQYHGFLRQPDGTVTTFDAPNAIGTVATAINARGQIAGWWSDQAYHIHGFVRDIDGHLTVADVPSATETLILGIDSKGDVAGTYSLADLVNHVFVSEKDGKITTVEIPDAILTFFSGMNPHGEVVGVYVDSSGNYHGWVRKP